MITTKSARVAILEATACGRQTCERVGGFGGSSAMIAHGLSCGTVLAAVERCAREIADWLYVAYACETYPGVHRRAVCCQASLYSAFVRLHAIRAEPARLLTLAGAAMEDMRRRYQGQPGHELSWYQSAVGFKRQNERAWIRAIEQMLGVLDTWDRRGLAEVAAVLPHESEGLDMGMRSAHAVS